jgi:acyl-CoA synthetase (AMP-forming)/AMP-acid ligase II
VNLLTLLDMAASGMPDRAALGRRATGTTYSALLGKARSGAAVLRERNAEELVYLGSNGPAFPVALFAAAWAGIPLVPLNYRLSDEKLLALLAKHPKALVITDSAPLTELDTMSTAEWLASTEKPVAETAPWSDDPDAVAVLLYTSGTSAEPKAAILRHRHLVSYLLGGVEFAGAGEHDAALVSVPPYHIAGIANLLSNVYSGRRLVYLESFSADGWLDCVRAEEITNALVVPTMLARITEHLAGAADGAGADVPTLRSLAYGGAKMPVPVLERAIRLFPGVNFVNAYGLTETSSTIAVLGPEDHRAAVDGDPLARSRLNSVGRVLPDIEVRVSDAAGADLPVGQVGEVYVRGPQVSGEYRGIGSGLDADGWFATRDRGWVDEDGYLFIEGRADDTIIRAGENIAPAEIEDVLLEHEAVAEAVVVGVPDEQWGQDIAAAVVLRSGHRIEVDELREWVRSRLRSSKTPSLIVFRSELPLTPTGKVVRRLVRDELAGAANGGATR